MIQLKRLLTIRFKITEEMPFPSLPLLLKASPRLFYDTCDSLN